MIRTSALILSIIILLTLTACGKTADGSVSPNESSILSVIPQIKATPGLETIPEHVFSDEPEQNENDEDIVITTSSTTPSPETAPSPTPTSTPTPQPILTPTPQTTDIPTSELSPSPEPEPNQSNISVTVGGSVFSVKLYDNDTARAFVALLPMTLNMSELNGNEKYYYLPDKLPTDSERVGSIGNGDLMLYGSYCLVLFYESFSTSYSYTRLGYVEDVSGLAAALGSRSVVIVFALND